MARQRKPARLWLRPARDEHKATWLILDGGRQIFTGLAENQRQEAEEALAAHLASKHSPTELGPRPASAVPIADVLSVYAQDALVRVKNRAKLAERLLYLNDHFGNKMLSTINAATCAEYAKKRTRGGGRRDLEDLRAAINYHQRLGLHTGTVIVTLPPKGKPRQRFLTKSEIARMVWVAWTHKRPQRPMRGRNAGVVTNEGSYHDLRHVAKFILIAYRTGSRSGPVLSASFKKGEGRSHMDLKAGTFTRLADGSEEAHNKLSPVCRISRKLMLHLKRWQKQGTSDFIITYNGERVKSIKNGWKRVLELAKIEGDVVPHTLRHSAVTHLMNEGYSAFQVGSFVGMSEMMVNQVYGHHSPHYQDEIANAL